MKQDSIVAKLLMLLLGIAATVAGFESAPMMFASLAALVTATMLITEAIKALAHMSARLTQLCSWLIAVILSMIGWYLELGIFADIQWYTSLIYGVGAALVANGIFDTGTVQLILEALLKLLPKKSKNDDK